MSGYENAPATKMLATHCAACGKELVDARSVEAGMGPDCRKKYQIPDTLDDETRTEANRLVYQIALDQKGPQVVANLARLRDLGCDVIVDRIVKRVRPIEVLDDGEGRFALKTPYDPDFVGHLRTVHGRRWDRERKVWTFPNSQKPWVWKALQKSYPGTLGLGPRGPFTVPA